MPRVITHGSIGTRQPLEVRADHTLEPQVLTLKLKSGQILDPTGGQLILKLFEDADDTAPLIDPSFDPPERIDDDLLGRPRFVISQSRALVAAALAALGPAPVQPATGRPLAYRRLYWTCSWLDSRGRKLPVYYGPFDIWLGAAGG